MSSNKDLSTLAKNIRKLREKKNLSQDKLSKLANIAHNTMIKIELGLIKTLKLKPSKTLQTPWAFRWMS